MDDVDDFVETMSMLHKDTSELEHFARNKDFEFSTMPLTAFVYQFFLYNSVYQVDWFTTMRTRRFRYHKDYESEQQTKFEQFLRSRDHFGVELRKAFQPLLDLKLVGEWTDVEPDKRITEEMGEEFFEQIRELQTKISLKPKVFDTDELYGCVAKCRLFIYKVRNNIFHGRKNLAQANESN